MPKDAVPRTNTNNEKRRTKKITFNDTEDPTLAEEQQRLQPDPYIHPTSTNSRRGEYVGRGNMSGRGGYGGQGHSDGRRLIIKESVPLPHQCKKRSRQLTSRNATRYNERDKLVITTTIIIQISETAIAIATQIKIANTAKISAEATDTLILSSVELNEEPEVITQSTMMNNDDPQSIPMEVDTDPRKRSVPTAIEITLTTNRITPTRNLR